MVVMYLFMGCSGNTKLANNQTIDSGGYFDEGINVPTNRQLMSIDTTNGNVVQIDPYDGTTNILGPVSMDYQINTMDINEQGVTYVYEHLSLKIGIFDPCTGDLEPLPVANEDLVICGIAFAPNGILYALDSKSDQLVSFNIETGEFTSIGFLDLDIGSCGLAYNSKTESLIGASAYTGELFNVDLDTGKTFNRLSTTVPFSAVGIEFDAETGNVLASTGTELYSIDLEDGSSNLIGEMTGYIDDLLYHPECP